MTAVGDPGGVRTGAGAYAGPPGSAARERREPDEQDEQDEQEKQNRPAESRAAPAGTPRARMPVRVPPALAIGLAAAAVGAAVRWWQISGTVSLGWNDTADFVAGSREPWLSLDLWAGRRPPAAAVLLKLLGRDLEAYVRLQAVVAVACWASLAASVATSVPGRSARWLAAAAVVAFSVTTPVTMWDRSVLSESLAVSALALVVAAGVQLARGVTGRRVALVLVAAVPWLATRDSHAVVVLAGGAAALLAGAIAWLRARRAGDDPGPVVPRVRPVAWLGVGALALGLSVTWASAHGERHTFPMQNVYEVRVLPYPDRVEWFADRGMPQAEVFAGPDARPPAVEPGLPPVMYVGDDDAELRPWLDWVESDGRGAFARFVATHPLYLVTEPLHTPERAFNNALGDRTFYRAPDMPRVPVVDVVLAPRTWLLLMVAALAAGWVIGARRWTPLVVAGVATAVLSVPHGMLAWHSDGMETARHLVVPALQLHLGVLLLVIGVLADLAARRAQTSGKPRSRLGRSSPPSASTTVPVT